MSFEEGNLRERVEELERANGILQASLDRTRDKAMRRGAVIVEKQERIQELECEIVILETKNCELESLVRDMFRADCHDCTVYMDTHPCPFIEEGSCGLSRRASELGIETEGGSR